MITIRDKQPSDEAFIYSTWLRGLYYGNAWFRQINKPDFFEKYRLVIQHLLNTSEVRVACLEEDPEIIVGYIVCTADRTTLHWVYVKEKWRQRGVGKSLVPETVNRCTHLTEKFTDYKNKKGWTFDPLLT